MNERKITGPVLAVALACLLVFLLLIAVFLMGQTESGQAEIVLPDSTSDTSIDNASNDPKQETLLQITEDNVVEALAVLERPQYYHQIYRVTIGNSPRSSITVVDLWVNGNLKRAQIDTEKDTKTILTDGKKLWVWYESNNQCAEFDVGEGIAFEDLLALPAFDYLHTLQQAQILETEYLVLDEGQDLIPCIFLSAQTLNGSHVRYWINLETGLLYVADSMEDNSQTYRVEQTDLDSLAAEDEAFSDRFTLPNGTNLIGETG